MTLSLFGIFASYLITAAGVEERPPDLLHYTWQEEDPVDYWARLSQRNDKDLQLYECSSASAQTMREVKLCTYQNGSLSEWNATLIFSQSASPAQAENVDNWQPIIRIGGQENPVVLIRNYFITLDGQRYFSVSTPQTSGLEFLNCDRDLCQVYFKLPVSNLSLCSAPLKFKRISCDGTPDNGGLNGGNGLDNESLPASQESQIKIVEGTDDSFNQQLPAGANDLTKPATEKTDGCDLSLRLNTRNHSQLQIMLAAFFSIFLLSQFFLRQRWQCRKENQ